MVAIVETVAFEGIEARSVMVEVQLTSGLPAFTIVGLADKAVTEARERVRAALAAVGLSLPAERITVNLSPADMPKEGSHYDLPIACALMAAMGAFPQDIADSHVVLGELGLNGSIKPVLGCLPAAIHATAAEKAIILPAASGSEAAWAGARDIIAADHLLGLINHIRGHQLLATPVAKIMDMVDQGPDLADIKGQESAKRALEVAAAGGHHMLMIGPPGSGKSMLAARLPGLLPPLSPAEALEVSMIASVGGQLEDGQISRARPFRAPHHSASLPALVGGGQRAKPGEVSFAHRGVLFLDELPEFSRQTLEALRQPLESGKATIARAAAHVTYPARFQMVGAMNPCRCGYLGDEAQACSRAPRCGADYQAKISGPMFDRMDLVVDVPAVTASDLTLPPARERSADVASRVAVARDRQRARLQAAGAASMMTNAELEGELLEQVAMPDDEGHQLMTEAIAKMRLSARGYHRVLRVARTIADLDGADQLARHHIAEALAYRRISPQAVKVRA